MITVGGKSTYATQSSAVLVRSVGGTEVGEEERKLNTSEDCQAVACLHSLPPWANSSAIPVISMHLTCPLFGCWRTSWITVVQERFMENDARAEESWERTGGEVCVEREWRTPAVTVGGAGRAREKQAWEGWLNGEERDDELEVLFLRRCGRYYCPSFL